MAGFHTKTFLKHDDYMTPKYAWENINQYIPKDKVIWEAFYGDGESGKYLKELGFDVIHEPIDFFESNEGDIIVSNPPFSNKSKTMIRLKELDNVFLLPHMSSATLESRIEMGEKVIINIQTFSDGHTPPDIIFNS